MKLLLACFLICCWAGTTLGQTRTALPVDRTTHRICYSALVSVPGNSQADLLSRAREWAQSIGSLDKPAVITHTKDTDLLVAYGTQPFAYTYAYTPSDEATTTPQHYTINLLLHYTITLSLQEGRYTYQVTDFVFNYPTAKKPSPTQLPAEDDLIHVRPINERGAKMITAERTCFQETTKKILAQLQKQLSEPRSQLATE